MGRAVAAEPALLEPAMRVEAGADSFGAIMSLTAEQLAERGQVIGGSDAAAIVGASPYRGPLDVYLEKRGLVIVEESEPMRWGTLLEPVIRDEWAQRKGLAIVTTDETFRHRDHPWCVAHPDALLADRSAGVEIKNIGEWRAKELTTAAGREPLFEHYCQVQHYMEVMSLPAWWIVYLIGGNRLEEFCVQRDAAFGAWLIGRERTFYEERLTVGVAPSHQESADAVAALRAMYPQHVPPVLLDPTPELRAACERLRLATERACEAEREETAAKADVMALLGEAEGVAYEGCCITWRTNKRGTRVFRPQFWTEEE
jgi:putative phage-type endonuclease